MKAVPTDQWKPLEDAIAKDIFKAEVQAWAKRIKVQPKEMLPVFCYRLVTKIVRNRC